MTEPYDPDTDPNPWRETVRDIYDFIHLHTDIARDVAFTMNIIAIIDERHPRYFGIGEAPVQSMLPPLANCLTTFQTFKAKTK